MACVDWVKAERRDEGMKNIPKLMAAFMLGVAFIFSAAGSADAAAPTLATPATSNLSSVAAPSGSQNGADSFAFTVSDGAGGGIAGTTFAITMSDNVPPVVTSVTVPANGAYGAGQNLDFYVNFSENVTLTGTVSIPVTLDTGGTVNAVYVSGSGTAALLFRYTIANGDYDTTGITLGSALVFWPGTIKDAAGNNAILTLNNVGATTGVFVDTIPPTVIFSAPSVTSTTSGPVSYTVTYGDPNFNTSTLTPGDITLNSTGSANAVEITVTGSGNMRTVTLNGITGSGTLGISIAPGTASDAVGNMADAAGPTATVIVCTATAATVANTADSGPGSLRQAILDICPGGTIDFGVTGTITLTSGQLDINKALTIAGPGPADLTVLQAGGAYAFVIAEGVSSVIIKDLTVGSASPYSGSSPNCLTTLTNALGCVLSQMYAGTGIVNQGGVSVSGCVFQADYFGIFNSYSGNMLVENSIFTGNLVAIGSMGNMTVSGAAFSGNRTGIFAFPLFSGTEAITNVTNSIFADNDARSFAPFAAGITNYGKTLTVGNSTFSGNVGGAGGALHNFTEMFVANSTFAGNAAVAMNDQGGNPISGTGIGGAILSYTEATIANCTITCNTAVTGGGVGGSTSLSNSILSANGGGNCAADNVFGGFPFDGGHNIEDGSGCGFGPTSLSSTDPLLDPVGLGDNGGPTRTIALLPGSPAVDAADASVCAAPPVNNHDQRGIARPQGAGCDIGAFELKGYTLTVAITGSGSVHGASTLGRNYSCANASCSPAVYGEGDQATLTASPSADYIFGGWGGDCTAASGDCVLAMTADRSVTATFNFVEPVRLFYQSSSHDYGTLAEAYGAIADNGSATLYCRLYDLAGGFTLDRQVTLLLKGGYDVTFADNSSGMTTIQGALTVGKGVLTAERLIVR